MRKGILAAVAALALAGSAAMAVAHDMDDMKGMDMKAKPGKTITVTGEVLDMDCYMNEGAHGKEHQSCAVMCLNNGAPVGLLTDDGKVYFLTANEAKGMTKFYDNVRGWGGDKVKITGTVQVRSGVTALRIDGAEKL